MTPKQLKDRISHDPRLDAFNAKFGRKLRDEYLLEMMEQAEQEVLIDTRARVKERKTTVTPGQRAVNLENDFLVPIQIRYKDEDDDALAEGIPVQIVDESKLF